MKLELSRIPATLLHSVKRLGRFRVVLFVVFVLGLYGYLVFQIGQAASVEPTPAEQLTTVKPSPRIDPNTVKQLQQLQDNSVSVKALFNDERSNPFQ